MPTDTHSLDQAPFASLQAVARGTAAESLVTALTGELVAWERSSGKRKRLRDRQLAGLGDAVAAFTADLLHAQNHPEATGWVYRPLAKGSFTGQAVSARSFSSVTEGWAALGMLEVKPGYTQTVEFDPGEPIRTRGKATRFRATAKLLEVCAKHGVTPQGAGEHFGYPPPDHPLALSSTSRRVGARKEPGKRMDFERTSRTDRLEAPVRELNDFIARRDIRGATHRFFERIFQEGDRPGFDWNKGGRLYSFGKDCYQQLPRDERLRITIDGEAVCEVDVRASYLTILHAQQHTPFKVSKDDDPYDIPGLPRSAVKTWCAVRLGTKGRFEQWSKESVAEYAKKNDGDDLTRFRVRDVADVVCQKHPLLKRWQSLPETWADLMWLESEAVLGAMMALMRMQNAPSLPVHDSLLVPASFSECAKEHLTASYSYFCRARPYLAVHGL